MSQLQQRIDKLLELRKDLITGNPERKLNLGSYIQLLDYHIQLLREVNKLSDDIRDGNKEGLARWMLLRIGEDYVHTSECENSQLAANRPVEAGTDNQTS